MILDKISISIIIPVLNDNEEVNLTIQSIYQTSPDNIEIIVIDDASDIPVIIDDKRVKLFRFDKRKGAGQARHYGALNATSKHLLFIDAHMRFDIKWFENAINRIVSTPKILWCGACLGLDAKNMDINKPQGIYTGADLVLYADKNKTIFDGVWRPEIKDKDDYEISCVMGACYFIHKDWYFHIKGLEQTMMWGSEEPILSIKTWLAGGEVRLMKSVRLGHKFRNSSPYSTNVSHIHYNKLAYMYMLFPTDLYGKMVNKFNNDGNRQAALNLVEKNKVILDVEKEYYKTIFQYDIYWLCDKFKIEML
jgi:glycosyltransferase involved in cell wall biosynthesis